jgi:hypothetical protein
LNPDEPFSYKGWVEAVRAGRTFVTNAPLLKFDINGHRPGDSLDLPAETNVIHIHAEAHSLVPFQRLEIIHNGEIVAEQQASGSPAEAVLDTEQRISDSGWWATRCGDDHHINTTICPQPVAAHTSPIYVRLEGKANPQQKAASRAVAAVLGRANAMIKRMARQRLFASDRHRERLGKIFESAHQEIAKHAQ